jgi:hypothetical protein
LGRALPLQTPGFLGFHRKASPSVRPILSLWPVGYIEYGSITRHFSCVEQGVTAPNSLLSQHNPVIGIGAIDPGLYQIGHIEIYIAIRTGGKSHRAVRFCITRLVIPRGRHFSPALCDPIGCVSIGRTPRATRKPQMQRRLVDQSPGGYRR